MSQRNLYPWLPVVLLLAVVVAMLAAAGAYVYQKHMHVEKLVAEVDTR